MANNRRTRPPKTRDVKQPSRASDDFSTGRPTDYRPEFDDLAYNYTLLGATDKKLAEFFGVTEQTINNWKIAHPSFFESVKRGKMLADATVAKSLFGRANGYSHKAVKFFSHEGTILQQEYVEHYPPDTAAAIFWLKNRCPEMWRDKQQLEHSGPNGKPIQLEDANISDIERELVKRGAIAAPQTAKRS